MDNGDREIVKMLLDKNALGLELVIDKYSSMVYALIHRIMGKEARREDIEECTSDVFVDVWNSIEEFDEMRGTFKTWVLIKAKFKALDYRRKINRRYMVETECDEVDIEAQRIHRDKNEVEEQLLRKEDYKRVLGALKELNETDREIFKRRYFLYEDIESIAEKYNLSRSAVDNRLWRGRKILREFLSDNNEENLK